MSEQIKREMQEIFEAVLRAQMMKGDGKMVNVLQIKNMLDRDGREYSVAEINTYLSEMIDLKLIVFFDALQSGVRFFRPSAFGKKRWAMREQVAAGKEGVQGE